jgi:hypothetical protein
LDFSASPKKVFSAQQHNKTIQNFLMANLCVFTEFYPAPSTLYDQVSKERLPEQMAALRSMMESGVFDPFHFNSALYYCPQIPFECPFFEAFLEQFPDTLNNSLDRVQRYFYCLLESHFKFISPASWVALLDGHSIQSAQVIPKEILLDKALLLHAIPRLLHIKLEHLAAFHDDGEVMGAFLRKRPYSACRVYSDFPPALQTVALAKVAMKVDRTGTIYIFHENKVVPSVSQSPEVWGAALESGVNISVLPSVCRNHRPTVLKAAGFAGSAKMLFHVAPAFSGDREIVLRALTAYPDAYLDMQAVSPELYAECCAVSPAVYRFGRDYEQDLRLDSGVAVSVFSKDGQQIRHYPTFPIVPPRFLLQAVANTGSALGVLESARIWRIWRDGVEIPPLQLMDEAAASLLGVKNYMRDVVCAQAGTVQALVAHQWGGRGAHGRNALNRIPEELMHHVNGFLGGIKREYKLAFVARANIRAVEDEKLAAEQTSHTTSRSKRARR